MAGWGALSGGSLPGGSPPAWIGCKAGVTLCPYARSRWAEPEERDPADQHSAREVRTVNKRSSLISFHSHQAVLRAITCVCAHVREKEKRVKMSTQ
ncbi:hypothetical protein P4O66_005083 [Electrophorus voltai]|uniref:Uncharacterized protein n=1 Tax=Electrophorus voltai TaxID=2609070 RepID=A0AAD9E6U8_9TELE|nr:hypothetical protein P4O66_005083 [Electrophorus voltai]